jgi:hypothetical protein
LRRFPKPWKVEELDACFKITDATGFAIAYVYFDAKPGVGYLSHLMTRDEAEIIALNIAKIGQDP